MQQVQALLFDVFGTVVDWRSGVIRDVTAAAGRAGVPVDAARFADQWRGGYRPAMDLVAQRAAALDQAGRPAPPGAGLSWPASSGCAGLPAAELDWLNACWHRLDPWPDSVPGLARLRQRYVLATFSNGNVTPAGEHGQAGRAAVGRHPQRRAVPPVQARSADLPRRRRAAQPGTGGGDAGRGAQRRPVRGGRPGPGHRVRAAARPRAARASRRTWPRPGTTPWWLPT